MAFTPDGSAVYLLGPRKELNIRAAQLRGITALGADKVQLATSEGLWQIDISELTAVRKNMQLHLTELRLNQHLYTVADLSQNIQLPADIEELQLKFNLLSYQPHLKVAYFYRWQGQQDWLRAWKRRCADLKSTGPGSASSAADGASWWTTDRHQTRAVFCAYALVAPARRYTASTDHFGLTAVSGLPLEG